MLKKISTGHYDKKINVHLTSKLSVQKINCGEIKQVNTVCAYG
jgi:ribosomal protein L32